MFCRFKNFAKQVAVGLQTDLINPNIMTVGIFLGLNQVNSIEGQLIQLKNLLLKKL